MQDYDWEKGFGVYLVLSAVGFLLTSLSAISPSGLVAEINLINYQLFPHKNTD